MRESFGTDTKSFHVGRAAKSGLLAAVLAQQGFGASKEGSRLNGVGACSEHATKFDAEFSTLGKTWKSPRIPLKLFPVTELSTLRLMGGYRFMVRLWRGS